MSIFALGTKTPTIAKSAWVAHDANIIGNIQIGENASVWFGATLRGDNELIHLGAGSNIQENCVLHTDYGYPLMLGENCTIGHMVTLHGCYIGNNSLIGMGATILNGAKIGENCLIGAGALITENKIIPDGSMVLGSPGRVVKDLSADQIAGLAMSALHYQENARRFRDDLQELS